MSAKTDRHSTRLAAKDLVDLLVAPEDSLLLAMRIIEEQSVELAFVRDESNRVVGTLSDGDIRRAILRGVEVTAPSGVRQAMHTSFRWVSPDEGRAEVLELMKALNIAQIPVLDSSGRLIGLHLIYDLISRHQRPNHAVVMAGGKGVRLRPITEHIPKPMVDVAGRPILERIVLHLVSHGIRDIWLAINYLGSVIERHFEDGSRFGCRIRYLREEEPRGTGGALALLPAMDEALLVLNGDLVTHFNIDRLIDAHEGSTNHATIGVREHANEVPFGVVECERGKLVEIREKPTHRYLVNAGIYMFSPAILNRVPQTGEFPITELFADCLRRGDSVGVHLLDGDWIDVGQHDSLRAARGEVTQ